MDSLIYADCGQITGKSIFNGIPVLSAIPGPSIYFDQGQSHGYQGASPEEWYSENDVIHSRVEPLISGINCPLSGRKVISESALLEWKCCEGYTEITVYSCLRQYWPFVAKDKEGWFGSPNSYIVWYSGNKACYYHVEFYNNGITSEGLLRLTKNVSAGQPYWYPKFQCPDYEVTFYRQKPSLELAAKSVMWVDAAVRGQIEAQIVPHYDVNTTKKTGQVKYVDPETVFLFGETDLPCLYGPFPWTLGVHYRNTFMQKAYLNALSTVDSVWDNGIQNIQAIFDLINDLRHHRLPDVPKTWKDAWLNYRYVINTTILDYTELQESFLKEEIQDVISSRNRFYITHGQYNYAVEGVDVMCKCKVYLKSEVYDFLSSFLQAIEKYGLTPDLYLLWDMTPYSFVIDWFLPIGDALDATDANAKFRSNCYTILKPVFSFKYEWDTGSGMAHCYSRWVSEPPSINGFYQFFLKKNGSSKTWCKRLLDSISLFT